MFAAGDRVLYRSDHGVTIPTIVIGPAKSLDGREKIFLRYVGIVPLSRVKARPAPTPRPPVAARPKPKPKPKAPRPKVTRDEARVLARIKECYWKGVSITAKDILPA